MYEDFFSNAPAVIATMTLGGAVIYACYQIVKIFFDFENRRIREAKEKDALSAVIDNLSSKEYTSRMIKDPTIESGIFDSHLSECFVSNLSTDTDSRKLADNKEMSNWLSRLK